MLFFLLLFLLLHLPPLLPPPLISAVPGFELRALSWPGTAPPPEPCPQPSSLSLTPRPFSPITVASPSDYSSLQQSKVGMQMT
jgi:hypothetical protein